MAETLTNRVQAIKNDNAELVNILEIDAGFDKFDNHFIPACKLFNSIQQTVANNTTPTVMQFDTVLWDSYAARAEGPMADLVNDKITIRKDGIYTVSLNGNWIANATGVRRLDVMKNTILIAGAGPALGFVGGQNGQGISQEFSFVVGDVIQGNLFQNSGAGLDFGKNTFGEGACLSVTWKGSLVAV